MPQAYAIRLTLIASILVVAQAVSAQAALFQFNFVGTITANDTTGPLKGLLNPNFPNAEDGISGFLRYDASTPASPPGVFDIPGAVFHAVFDGGTVDATGVTAQVSANQDALFFRANVPVSQFLPTVISTATMSLGFETFTDGFFSLTTLPTTLPINDKTLGFEYTAGSQIFGASTDTNIVVTLSAIPEPASIALLGLGLVGAVVARSRRMS